MDGSLTAERGTLGIRLPRWDDDAWLATIRELLGPAVASEVLLSAPKVAPSPWSGPFIDILRRQLATVAPAVPQMISGITDSRYFRQRGIAAYGFTPFILGSEYTRTVHARDERIRLDEFERGKERMTSLVAEWAGGTADQNDS